MGCLETGLVSEPVSMPLREMTDACVKNFRMFLESIIFELGASIASSLLWDSSSVSPLLKHGAMKKYLPCNCLLNNAWLVV